MTEELYRQDALAKDSGGSRG